jgi:hypothetical protein
MLRQFPGVLGGILGTIESAPYGSLKVSGEPYSAEKRV